MKSVGFFISALGHLAILLAVTVSMPAFLKERHDPMLIPVEILEIGSETNVRAAAPNQAEVEEIKDTKKEEVRFADSPPPPPPMNEPVPSDAMPDLNKKPEKKPEPKKTETAKIAKTSMPRRKPQPPKKQDKNWDANDLQALLDKEPQDKPKPKAEQSDDALDSLDDFLAEDVRENSRRSIGAGDGMTVSEIDALRQEMQKCWRPPTGAANPEELVVELKIYLNKDGTLQRPPVVLRSGTSSFNKNSFTAAAERAAQAAVSKCAPYDFLPADKYEKWDEVTITFDPAAMIGY